LYSFLLDRRAGIGAKLFGIGVSIAFADADKKPEQEKSDIFVFIQPSSNVILFYSFSLMV